MVNTPVCHGSKESTLGSQFNWSNNTVYFTDKTENKIFLIYKEIQSGAVAKSYMKNGFLIYEEVSVPFSEALQFLTKMLFL